tara:strand:- start:27 stop:536 length:510 start_codon:yes stop_codon:yes gene_type:complete
MKAKLLSRLGIEIWKDIPNYNGIYQVSNLGNIKSLKFNKVKYLKLTLNSEGRYAVSLYKNGILSSNKKLSVLVAEAFLNHTPCGHKLVVDHIDNNPLNDKLYNLQIITHRKNLTKDKKNGTSKYIGVFKYGKRWRSEIGINNTKNYLGTFNTEIEASQAYQKELNKIKL